MASRSSNSDLLNRIEALEADNLAHKQRVQRFASILHQMLTSNRDLAKEVAGMMSNGDTDEVSVQRIRQAFHSGKAA